MKNGEIPPSLQPEVWWILIGTNDFLYGQEHCSDEVVLMGIKRVVSELRALRPKATVVLNGILPRSEKGLKGLLVDRENPEKRLPWDAILDVNKGLQKICEKEESMHYFDASHIFLRPQNKTLIDGAAKISHESEKGTTADVKREQFIPKELMRDYLHPTATGYKEWGKAINIFLHKLLN